MGDYTMGIIMPTSSRPLEQQQQPQSHHHHADYIPLVDISQPSSLATTTKSKSFLIADDIMVPKAEHLASLLNVLSCRKWPRPWASCLDVSFISPVLFAPMQGRFMSWVGKSFSSSRPHLQALLLTVAVTFFLFLVAWFAIASAMLSVVLTLLGKILVATVKETTHNPNLSVLKRKTRSSNSQEYSNVNIDNDSTVLLYLEYRFVGSLHFGVFLVWTLV